MSRQRLHDLAGDASCQCICDGTRSQAVCCDFIRVNPAVVRQVLQQLIDKIRSRLRSIGELKHVIARAISCASFPHLLELVDTANLWTSTADHHSLHAFILVSLRVSKCEDYSIGVHLGDVFPSRSIFCCWAVRVLADSQHSAVGKCEYCSLCSNIMCFRGQLRHQHCEDSVINSDCCLLVLFARSHPFERSLQKE